MLLESTVREAFGYSVKPGWTDTQHDTTSTFDQAGGLLDA
jgi:hypothetical protein